MLVVAVEPACHAGVAPAMVEGVVGTLQAAGVPKHKLRPERFSG